jgi:hypothetical protein
MQNGQFLRNIRIIMKRELAGYFGSPVAYVFIVIFLLLTGFFTFYISNFFEAGQADLKGFSSGTHGCSCFWCRPLPCGCGRRSVGWEPSNCC